ncbi:uncharacterized protein LOC114840169 [Esox lucius]|uniref:uncharacterized protein LOC114840169 n=1 Tax=Esox lucius TaxID=8010 RepID=UPI0010BD37DD|nr:uncharacterized protein LOC114840169 [Esox lucius]
MVWGSKQSEVTRGHIFSITCSIQLQYPGGLFYLDFSGTNRTETKPAVNHSASFHFPVAEYKHEGNYSCSYEVNVTTRTFHSTRSELLTVSIQASPALVTVSGTAVGILLLLILVAVSCVVWRKRMNRPPPMTMSQRQCGNCEDEKDYINMETIDNQRYDDLETRYCAGRTAPGATTRVGNNEDRSKATETIYEIPDSFTEMAIADESGNDYEEDENIYENLG